MPSRFPARVLNVYMVGAGLSTAFGIPNTPSLLSALVDFSRTRDGKWLATAGLEAKLQSSYRFFYPDALNIGFRPDPVDYFSALRTFIDVGSGFPGTSFKNPEQLYRTLKRGIAHVLIDRARSHDQQKLKSDPYLTELMQVGNVIITSNWDTLLERFATLNGIPYRLTTSSREFSEQEVTVLKLHGSVDWCRVQDRATGFSDADYANLTERQNAPRSYKLAIPTQNQDLLRVRNGEWVKVRSRTRDHWMVTMVTGKQDDLGPLKTIWRDAFRALSRAKTLEIVGYSMPPDDVEVRSLLRAGIEHGTPSVMVRNPAPDVHYRVRAFLDRAAGSDYQPV